LLFFLSTAVASGTVGTVPTVPLFLAGTANRTTIWTEKIYFEMRKGYSLLMSVLEFLFVIPFPIFDF
jgi:hypothetical protein